eukprot:TRINITY_DN26144_c0_g1_i1.p1 TRINITY_DN26144_c0_g1~~TRINITY_DN26144_c0_g1_i1.p1  ORF type:complete len:924 (+),score=387.79 TRINITY_DN26144_c0_g1_i1:58-2829(+)
MQTTGARSVSVHCLRAQARGKWTYVEPEELHSATFNLKSNKEAEATLNEFARKLEAGFLNSYQETLCLKKGLTAEQAHKALQDNDLLPARDRELLLPLFQYALNNIGTADGLCRYGITTRGFELKMLNSIFTYLNFKTYGVKYGEVGDEVYGMDKNPDPDMTYGYFTLGMKEAAIWALRVALKKFSVSRIPGKTESMHAYFPKSYHLADHEHDIQDPAVFDVGGLLSITNTSAPASLEACLVDIKAKVKAYKDALKNGDVGIEEPSFFIAMPLQCSTCGNLEESECLKNDIHELRYEANDRLFFHVQTETYDDVLAMGNGYNLLKGQEAKYYAFPPMVHSNDYNESGEFFVDSISVGRAMGSMQSALLITTMRAMKDFTDAAIPYIQSEDASIVGSSNGHFLFFDNYFYSRFPLSIVTDLRVLKQDLKIGDAWKDVLSAYMKLHNLSPVDRESYRGLLGYLQLTYRSTFGYPANALFSDKEDAMERMHNVMLQEKLLMNMNVQCSESLEIDNLTDSTGTSYVKRFLTETIDYFKGVLLPKTHASYSGLITSGGTEGMYTCVYLASKKFAGCENAYLFCTKEAHYCVPKAANIFGFKQIEVATTDEESGNMDMDDLYFQIKKKQDEAGRKGNVKVVVVCNVASTVKGSTDSLSGANQVLEELVAKADRFLVSDSACQGGFFPFLPQGPDVMPFMRGPSDPKYVDIDGICVSGHKFLGSPFPSGMAFFRRDDVIPLLQENSRLTGKPAPDVTDPKVVDQELWDLYDQHGTVVTGKKNGYYVATLWKRVQESKNQNGMKKLAQNCDAVATYAMKELKKVVRKTGIRPYRNMSGANIIVLTPLPRKDVLDTYGMATEGENAHIVVMPHVSKQLIDEFIVDLKDPAGMYARRNTRHGKVLKLSAPDKKRLLGTAVAKKQPKKVRASTA